MKEERRELLEYLSLGKYFNESVPQKESSRKAQGLGVVGPAARFLCLHCLGQA